MPHLAFPESFTFTSDTIVATIAALAALFALYFSHRSNLFSKEALRLAKEDHDSKAANFSIYLVDSFRFVDKENSIKIIMFNITLNNKSEVKNSFKPTLEIEYIRSDSTVVRFSQEHIPALASFITTKKPDLSVFDEYINSSEREIESKWLLFKEPETFSNYKADKYTIKFQDLNGNKQQVSSTLLKNLVI